MNNLEIQRMLLRFLENTKSDLEKKGLIPTLDAAIEEFQDQIAIEIANNTKNEQDSKRTS